MEDDRPYPVLGDGKMAGIVPVALPRVKVRVVLAGVSQESMCFDHSRPSRWQTASTSHVSLSQIWRLSLDVFFSSLTRDAPCDTHVFDPFKHHTRQSWMKGCIDSVMVLQNDLGASKVTQTSRNFVSLVYMP
eukprot:4070189-Amphidinium_carterae.2